MKKSMMKVMLISLLIISILSCFCTVFAEEVAPPEYSHESISQHKKDDSAIVISNIGKRIVDVMMFAGFAIAIGTFIFVGIKLLIGPATDKADAKKMIPTFLIGIILILFPQTIAYFINSVAGGTETDSATDSTLASKIVKVGTSATLKGGGGEGTEAAVVEELSTSFINVILFFAFGIALAIFIMIGIKYLTSVANEKANIKHMLPMYATGLLMVLFCVKISTFGAEVAGDQDGASLFGVWERFNIGATGSSEDHSASFESRLGSVLDTREDTMLKEWDSGEGALDIRDHHENELGTDTSNEKHPEYLEPDYTTVN